MCDIDSTHAQVIFLHDQQQQVLSVVNGAADVAFVRADQPGIMASQGLLNITDVKILSPVSVHAYSCLHAVPAMHGHEVLSACTDHLHHLACATLSMHA